MIIRICLMVALSFFVASSLHAHDCSKPHKSKPEIIKWNRDYGDKNHAYQNKASAFSPNGKGLFVAGTYSSSAKGKSKRAPDGIWIWKINKDGNKTSDFRIPNKSEKKGNIVDIEGMAVLVDEKILLVVKLDDNETNLVRLNSRGNILSSKKLGKGIHISKVLSVRGNNFLLLGNESFNSLMIKISAGGEVLWKKSVDRGKDDNILDGIETEDGGFLLVENSGKREQFFMGASDVWLAKYDSKGNKKFEKSFPGRAGSITPTQEGGYAVTYDKSKTGKQDIWIQTFDKKLKESWKANVTETIFGLTRFTINSLKNGNYVVAGFINLRPWVAYFNHSGKKIWESVHESLSPAIGDNFAAMGDEFISVSSVVAIDEKYQPINHIRVINFQPEKGIINKK